MSDIDPGKLPPIHPGEILKEEFLVPLSISQQELAKSIDTDAQCIHAIVHGEESITAEMALCLSRFFGTSARFWTGLQSQYDLEVAKDRLATKLNAVKLHQTNGVASDVKLPPTGKCWCGCGGVPNKDSHFLQGHDQRALHKVIKSEYGSVLEFLRHHDYASSGDNADMDNVGRVS